MCSSDLLRGMKAEGYPFRGVLYCGLIITPNGPKVLEYNARFGDPETQALMVRLGSDLAQVLQEIARGKLETNVLDWKHGASVCVVACSAGYPGNYQAGQLIHGLADAENIGAKVFHSGSMRQNGQILTAGGRVLGITAAGNTLTEARRRAYAAAERVNFHGIHYRHDIGQKGLQRAKPLE